MAPYERADPSPSIDVLGDLRLHQRKAFELCAAVYSALRTFAVSPDERAMAAAARKASQLADDELNAQNNDVTFETFLADGLEKIIREAQESARNFPLGEAGSAALNALRQLRANPPTLTMAETSCPIRKTYLDCVEAAKKFYVDFLSRPYELPKISIRIGPADGLNVAFPGRKIAFNGSLRYEDNREPEQKKHSIVNLKVSPALLGRGSLPALPYILMHEILCHWPQMARRNGARLNPVFFDDPNNKDAKQLEVDPISEGWIDSLTAAVLRGRCTYPDRACLEEAETAQAMHDERVQINREPTFKDAHFIAPGHYAAELVLWLYSKDESAVPSAAAHDFHRLSCELNAADWSYHARKVGCNDIIRACLRHAKGGGIMSPRDVAIRDGLLAFRQNGDLTSLLRVLCGS